MKISNYLEDGQLNCIDIYHHEIISLIDECAQTEIMQRLKDVGMNCGCEYTSFERFKNLMTYSRFSHSLGVALIVYHFTCDEKQAVAGLLHDISTPVFAHVVDFLKGDYLKQEATEEKTAEMIASDNLLCCVLNKYNLKADDVSNYHLYPIADNDSPKLSADRLEYTLSNGINYGFCSKDDARKMYENLTVGINEEGITELCFTDEKLAEDFGMLSLKCSEVYVSDEDRYSMQILSEILADAIKRKVIEEADLYAHESEVIKKLLADSIGNEKWFSFRKMHIIYASDNPDNKKQYRVVYAKKRYIDPLIRNRGRLSEINELFRKEKEKYLDKSQNYYIAAE